MAWICFLFETVPGIIGQSILWLKVIDIAIHPKIFGISKQSVINAAILYKYTHNTVGILCTQRAWPWGPSAGPLWDGAGWSLWS